MLLFRAIVLVKSRDDGVDSSELLGMSRFLETSGIQVLRNHEHIQKSQECQEAGSGSKGSSTSRGWEEGTLLGKKNR